MASADRIRTLGTVVRLARAELASRKPDDIPHKLRPVARATGKGLPAPLARTLIGFIEKDDTFRAAVRERFESDGNDDTVARYFLEDPMRADEIVGLAAASGSLDVLKAGLESEQRKVAQAEARLATAHERMERARAEHAAELAAVSDAAKRSRESLEKQLDAARADVDKASVEIESLSDDMAILTSEVEDLRARLSRRDARESRRLQGVPPAVDRTTSVVPSDSVDIAVMLDDLVRKLRYYRTPDHRRSTHETASPDVSIPLGLSPESAAALGAVLTQGPGLMLLDGYNIAGGVSEGLVGIRQGRDAVIRRAESVKRASPSTDVVVIFDASGASGRGDFVTETGVRAVFEPLTSADDAIVAMVRRAPPGCVVITNDRELQNRVATHGAVVLFSTALLAWSEHLNTE